MTAQHRSTQLAAQVCQTLETAPDSTLPMTYQQLAEMLALEPPRTVQRVASALEVSATCHLATDRLGVPALQNRLYIYRGSMNPTAGEIAEGVWSSREWRKVRVPATGGS